MLSSLPSCGCQPAFARRTICTPSHMLCIPSSQMNSTKCISSRRTWGMDARYASSSNGRSSRIACVRIVNLLASELWIACVRIVNASLPANMRHQALIWPGIETFKVNSSAMQILHLFHFNIPNPIANCTRKTYQKVYDVSVNISKSTSRLWISCFPSCFQFMSCISGAQFNTRKGYYEHRNKQACQH